MNARTEEAKLQTTDQEPISVEKGISDIAIIISLKYLI